MACCWPAIVHQFTRIHVYFSIFVNLVTKQSTIIQYIGWNGKRMCSSDLKSIQSNLTSERFCSNCAAQILTSKAFSCQNTPPISEIIWVKNVRAIVVCGFLMKWLKKYILKIKKKSWEPFGSYLLNSKANPAHLSGNGLDWLCYLAGNSKTAATIFFIFSGYFFLNDFIKNPQTRNARAFLPLNISAVGSVSDSQ